MHTKRILALALMAVLAIGACNAATVSPSASAPASQAAESTAPSAEASASAPAESPSAAPLAVDPAEAVIPNVEANAEIGFWTFFLSPTFDQYIKDTITRFEGTYPGVKVNWEDHQATFQDDLKAAFAAGNAPDVINLSVSEGWVSDYASKDLLLPLDSVPQEVKDIYYPGLWNEQLVDGKNFQFPWYQGIAAELINKKIYEEGAGLVAADFPKAVDGLGPICKTILDKTGKVCDIRLTVNDLLAQMTYEGDVKVINDAGTAFTFDSPEGVAWLQMYVDMVTAGTVDKSIITVSDDRVGLLTFSSGNAPFYQTGLGLIRDVKANNPDLYNNMAVAPAPVGKSGVTGKGLMAISVKGDTKFPNASTALAQFFTNPRAMVDFAKLVPVYPSSPSAYDDPFFSTPTTAIEDSGRNVAKDIVATYADIVPTVPKKADVNAIVLKAVESALFNNVPAQQALTDAVTQANALIK
jgi:ABC-type glycerol-3-phosphate transport system substrate-binding protein